MLFFVLVVKSCLTFLQPHGLWSMGLLYPWDFPGKNTGVVCHVLLQVIFSTQGSGDSLSLSCQGSPGFPGGSERKVSPRTAGDPGSIPGSERSPGEGHGNPLQYSCLENPMAGGAWWAIYIVHGVTESWT